MPLDQTKAHAYSMMGHLPAEAQAGSRPYRRCTASPEGRPFLTLSRPTGGLCPAITAGACDAETSSTDVMLFPAVVRLLEPDLGRPWLLYSLPTDGMQRAVLTSWTRAHRPAVIDKTAAVRQVPEPLLGAPHSATEEQHMRLTNR